MNSLQKLIIKVITSIAIGIVGFCLTMPMVIFLGGLLFGPPEGHAFFSPRDAGLFLTSILVSLAVAVFVGIKYYLYLGS